MDLRDYSIANLRNQFAIVLQKPVLFSTSIAENIARAKPDATSEEIPTSSSDMKTEAVIMEEMTRLMCERITFMIAQRLSTLVNLEPGGESITVLGTPGRSTYNTKVPKQCATATAAAFGAPLDLIEELIEKMYNATTGRYHTGTAQEHYITTQKTRAGGLMRSECSSRVAAPPATVVIEAERA